MLLSKYIILGSFFICCLTSYGQEEVLQTYPGPEGVRSAHIYKVFVSQGGAQLESFVYYSTPLDNDADNADEIRTGVIKGINENQTLRGFYFGGEKVDLNAEQSCSWTCFSFAGKVQVAIQHNEPIESFKILPSSYNVQGEAIGNRLQFSLEEPRKLAIVINGDYLNPLFLFADAPERAVPDKRAPGTLVFKSGDDCEAMREEVKKASVLYFEPGVHHIGVGFEVYSNQTIYLEGGAYLLGTFHGYMASNVSFRGRGVLAGDSISRAEVLALKRKAGFKDRIVKRMRYHAINMLSYQNDTSWNAYANYPGHGCDNLNIEGITIASPRQFFIRATGVPITIHNVKMVGSWPYNTDGISTIGQANTTVYDCFFHCNDDAIYVSPNDAHIHHSVFWQGNNGCVFQFSWGGAPVNQGGSYIHDCEIVHMGHVSQANNRMVIGSRKSRQGDIGHVYFKNINIEGPVWSLFRLETNGSGNLGSLHDIKMENIHVKGPVLHKSTILSSKGRKEGEASTSWIRNITLKDIYLNGRKMTKDDIVIGDFQVKNIVIE